MKLAGDYRFDAPSGEVWKALLDPVVLAATMPGCEKLELVDGQYIGELNIKVGPVQGKFTSKIDLVDVVAPTSYTIKVDGRGAPGFVKATASVALEDSGSGTRMTYDSDANVGGRIASVGQRLIEASAKAIIKQSLEGMNEIVKARVAALSTPVAASNGSGAAISSSRSVDPGPVEEGDLTDSVPLRDAANVDTPTASSADSSPSFSTGPTGPRPHIVDAVSGRTSGVSGAPRAIVLPVPKPVDQAKFAAAVAKEISKTLLPRVALWAILALAVIGLISFVVSRMH